MKKSVLVCILACGWQTAAYAQETLRVDALKIGGSAAAADRATSFITVGNDDYVKIGEWEADDVMSLHARVGYNFSGGRVGIKTMDPQADCDVNGTFAAKASKFDGNVSVTGTFSSKDATINGNATVTGAISAASSTIRGNETVTGLFSAKDATIDGNVGIGIRNPTDKLHVNGTIRATIVKIEEDEGADFVFNDDYALRPLSEVNHFIQENKHLPEIPSAAEMQAEGVSVGELQMKLLQKIEELTLYMIRQDKKIEALNAEIEELKGK